MELQRILNRVYSEKRPRIEDLESLLSLKTPDNRDALFDFADRVRETHMGRGILLRGIVEFSNHCRNACRYCGLNRFQDGLERFRMTREEVLACIRNIDEAGIKPLFCSPERIRNVMPCGWLSLSPISKRIIQVR